MVSTRRQSKSNEPPALLPVAAPKRKSSIDARSASSAAQPPNQPSTKRRKKVKSTAKLDTSTVPTVSAPKGPAAKKARLGKKERLELSRERRHGTNQDEDFALPKINGTRSARSKQSAQVDLTNDNDSSESDTVRQPQPAASQAVDDDDADSRYALGSRRKGKTRKPAAPIARRTAELEFEEDGLEEVDKAEAVVANASNSVSTRNKKSGSLPCTSVNNVDPDRSSKDQAHQVNGKGKDVAKQKVAPPMGIPSKVVMFTVIEAISALSLYQGGTMSIPAEIDPQSRQPYESIQTGEYLSYPVKGTYHLGALGRYGIDTAPPLPFSLTVPLSEHSFIQHTQDTSTPESSRQGLGFSPSLPARPKFSTRRPNNYCFTFGKYRGRRMDSVPVSYLRSIFNSDDYNNDPKLQQAFADLYPKGMYESDAESYTFEKGGFRGKRLDEVPKSYVWGLLRKARDDKLPKKGKGRLERALETWEKGQLDLTKD